jgi:hypothetical protein
MQALKLASLIAYNQKIIGSAMTNSHRFICKTMNIWKYERQIHGCLGYHEDTAFKTLHTVPPLNFNIKDVVP